MSSLKSTIRVVLGNEHQLFRLGFEKLLERCPGIELVAQTANGNHVLSLVQIHQPEVVVTDIDLPDLPGEELTRRICKVHPGTAVMIVTVKCDNYSIMKLLSAGASAYLLESADAAEVIEGIRMAARAEKYYCRTTREQIRKLAAEGRFDPKTMEIRDLTGVELRIIRMICEGKENREISNTLRLTVDAIKKHRKTILKKAGAETAGELVGWAKENGLC